MPVATHNIRHFVTGDAYAIVPGTDAGIQIGWDDVQVTTWVNRQIQIAQALARRRGHAGAPLHRARLSCRRAPSLD